MQIPNPGDNLTIGDLVQRYLDKEGNKAKKGYIGTPLLVEQAPYSQVMSNIVDSLYQRMLSHAKVKSYGQCNLGLLVACIISRRPAELEEYAGDYVIDGQHKGVIYGVNCDENSPPVTQQVLVHKYDHSISKIANLKNILMAEAELFWSLNTLRKKLTKVDELRAEVVCGEEDALHIQSVMQELNVQNDGFGSTLDSALEVTNFGQFYYIVSSDYSKNVLGLEKIKRGYKLWSDVYGFKNKVHGVALRALCFIDRYIEEGLSNGKAKRFREWIVNNLAAQFSQEALVKGFGSFDSPRWVLYRVIEKYNSMETNINGRGAQTLGPVTLIEAVEKSGEKRFQHPDDVRWGSILKEACDS
jgi:hypothetical protein